MGDHADGHALGFQDRALLDVQFEGSVNRFAHGLIAGITDARQFLAHGLAIDIGARQSVFQGEHTGKDTRGDHRRRKA